MATRTERVKRIFQQFDVNKDGGLNKAEMAALVVAVNPRVKFSDEQVNAILNEVFRSYAKFIDGDKGLTYDGFLRTYDDGAGDVDHDFETLNLDLVIGEGGQVSIAEASTSSTAADEGGGGGQQKKHRAPSPNLGIVFDDLAIVTERLKQVKDGKLKND